LSRFSRLAARTVGVAPGRVFGHATATRLIGGWLRPQLGGADKVPIEAARPNPGPTANAALPGL
jgi:hypothetical protein